MITLKIVPLFGSGITGKSKVVTRQTRVNCYVEQRPDGDKSKVAIYGTPGLVPTFTLGTLPVRGMIGTETDLFAVTGNTFNHLNVAKSQVGFGTVNTLSGSVSLSTNNTQVVIADGFNGYLYLPATHAFSTLGASYPSNAQTVTQVSGFFVAEQPGTQQFWVSNFNDGSMWNSLSFASASAYPDRVVAVDNLSGNLVVFSEQHMEFWQNSGLTPQPFTPIISATNEFGLSAIFSRAHVGDSILCLAENRQGLAQVVRIRGYTVRPISAEIDYVINSFPRVNDAVALSYGVDTHWFYQLTFPTANRSFLYDLASDLWSEVQTGISINRSRHTANFSTYFAGGTTLSDYSTNQLYSMSPTVYTDNGKPILREIVTRHVLSAFNRIRPSVLYLDMETGVGLQNGQGSNPQVMLQYSKDNGRTWSAERWCSLGKVGQYTARVIWRRFGCTRDATFRIRMSDPVKFVITEGAMKVRQKAA